MVQYMTDYKQMFNTTCGHYCEDYRGEKYCAIHMDMTFCGKYCAFATNLKGHTEAYEAHIYENYKSKRKEN